MGFEPMISTLARSRDTTSLRTRISNYTLAEGTGFEPAGPCDPPRFQRGAIGRSATPPTSHLS